MRITIVLTSYNYGHYIPEAIESVLVQSFSDFELIIVDDASTDDSCDIIHDYAKQDKRIQVIEHKKNVGINETVYDGFNAAKGLYFHALSADDRFLPCFLEKSLKLLEQNPQIGLCCSDYGYFYENESTKVLTNNLIDSANHPLVFSPLNIVSVFRRSNFWIPGHTTIVKRKLMTDYGFYNSRLFSLVDWFLLHKIALFEGAGYIPETLATMRLHANSYSSSCHTNKTIKKDMYFNLLKILESPENIELRKKYKKAALLGFAFKDIEALKHPKLWSFYPYLIRKSLRYRWKKLWNKPFLSPAFLEKMSSPF